MHFPSWVSWIGLLEHVVAGAALTVVFGMLCPGSVTVFAIVALLAAAHEQAQQDRVTGKWWSDFRPENGGPYNGALDIASFLLLPLFYVVFH